MSAVQNERAATPETPIQFLRGVGVARASAFQAMGLTTVRDLLFFLPFRYEDRRHPAQIASLGRLEHPVVLRGRVVSAGAKVSPIKRVKIFEAMFDDGTGTLMLVWFNQAYLADQIKRGDRLAVFGQPHVSKYGGLQIDSPDWEKLDDTGEGEEEGSIVPIYSRVSQVPPKTVRRIVRNALDSLGAMPDPMPAELRKRLGVIDLATAIHQIHQPQELTEEFLARRSPAHRRLILQEFFTFQLALRVRRAGEEIKPKTRRVIIDDAIRDEVKKILPFKLTAAQRRVLKEIAEDLQGARPMYRLLQGDVGSGKTIVALIAAVIAIRNGHQVALLAPTEILVEQHYQRIRQLLDDSVVIAKATGAMAAKERRTFLAGLREGLIQFVVGTHALLEERVVFKSLGLAIVDEQHRFGVEQRQSLFAKGETPDILVMTATPIPRSLALATYGDLELSVIDEMPPGRQRIRTEVRGSLQIDRIFDFAEAQIAGGAQIYVVYPIIEESEKLNLKPLSQGFETIRSRFPNRRAAMLHGRMPSAEKEETMDRFKRGEIDLLVSTTVIEVGIDVPNASLMLVMDADRFGFSQLHQLRGRIGRGPRKSYCVLIRDERAPEEAKDRLRKFAETIDGFDVAERDLEIRGPGEFLGTRQSGVSKFRFGNIQRDQEMMESARNAAIDFLASQGLPAGEKLVGDLLGVTLAAANRD
ncbi:MAG TPA: ATP-dependent DNA helicase RecG [Thermoanaerobaculia bacterium]|nr:ATP-dependent DNA helicase RecG [Thermoanaerobaculia bacterium]